MKIGLLVGLVVWAISFAWPIFAQQKDPTPSESIPEAKPAHTFGDRFTQILPDRGDPSGLFAPKANPVDVVIGIKSGTYEPQSTIAEMAKDLNGLWIVTLGPLELNVYSYHFRLDRRTIVRSSARILGSSRQVLWTPIA